MTPERIPIIFTYLIPIMVIAACSINQSNQLETPSEHSTSTETESSLTTALPPTIPVVNETSGVIVGKIDNTTGPLPDDVDIWVIKLHRSPEGYGIYALNTLTTPSFPVDSNGYFQAFPIEPGEYVIVVGTSPENAIAIAQEDGQARPYDVLAGEVMDVGTETVALTLPPPIEERPTFGYPPPQPTLESSYP